jgi:hypothetical protein
MRKNVLPAVKGIYQYENGKHDEPMAKWAERYYAAGGPTQIMKPMSDFKRTVDIDKAIDQIGKKKNMVQNTRDFMNWAASCSDAVELGTRLATFKAAVESGMSDQEAAVLSRNVTINFNKKGELSALGGACYLMFNGGLQGKVYLLKRMATSPLARKIYGGIFAAGFLSAAMNNQLSDDSDPANSYAALSEFEKQNNFIFKNPFGKGFFKIPAGHGMNLPFYLGSKVYEVGFGKSSVTDAAMNVAAVGFNSFSPISGSDFWQTVVPTEPGRYLVQFLENKNAFGSPIYKDQKFGAVQPDSHTEFKNTSPMMAGLAHGLNRITGGTGVKSGLVDISPNTMQWLFDTGMGGVGRVTNKTVDLATSGIEHAVAPPGDITVTPVDVKNVPFLEKFFTEGREADYKGKVFDILQRSGNNEISGEETNQFYEAMFNAMGRGQINYKQFKTYQKQFLDNQTRIDMGNTMPDWEKKDFDLMKPKHH